MPYSTVSFRMTLSALAKYSMTKSCAVSLRQCQYAMAVSPVLPHASNIWQGIVFGRIRLFANK